MSARRIKVNCTIARTGYSLAYTGQHVGPAAECRIVLVLCVPDLRLNVSGRFMAVMEASLVAVGLFPRNAQLS